MSGIHEAKPRHVSLDDPFAQEGECRVVRVDMMRTSTVSCAYDQLAGFGQSAQCPAYSRGLGGPEPRRVVATEDCDGSPCRVLGPGPCATSALLVEVAIECRAIDLSSCDSREFAAVYESTDVLYGHVEDVRRFLDTDEFVAQRHNR